MIPPPLQGAALFSGQSATSSAVVATTNGRHVRIYSNTLPPTDPSARS